MSRKHLTKHSPSQFKIGKYVSAGKRKAVQVGALCTRKVHGKRQVLLITSRRTRRWIIPKGWQMAGISDGEAAAIEAWEEAGVAEAKVSKKPFGKYTYDKDLDNGVEVPVKVKVYKLKVRKMKRNFPERHERRQMWVSPKRAAKLVREPKLKKLLLKLHK